tara:strand:- start:613 stop:1023 length:411 start_codon:yes stop_codon:yes gene_type:complete
MFPLTALLEVGGKLIDKLVPDPTAKAKAQLELAALAQSGELAKMANDTEVYKTEQTNVTERWKSDNSTDSWLNKNIRPLSLVAIFVGYFLFAMMSAFGYNANESYVNLLGQWGMLIMSAYFGGKTLENIIAMKTKK